MFVQGLYVRIECASSSFTHILCTFTVHVVSASRQLKIRFVFLESCCQVRSEAKAIA